VSGLCPKNDDAPNAVPGLFCPKAWEASCSISQVVTRVGRRNICRDDSGFGARSPARARPHLPLRMSPHRIRALVDSRSCPRTTRVQPSRAPWSTRACRRVLRRRAERRLVRVDFASFTR
jgi:hypothetical protein